MRGDIVKMLTYEAKRRPEIAVLMERAVNMTEAEIDAANVPLPWFRNALKQHAAKERMKLLATSAVYREGFRKDEEGELLEWIAPDGYVDVDRGGGIFMQTGSFLWADARGIWAGTAFSKHIDPTIFHKTVSRGRVPRSVFLARMRDVSNQSAAYATPMGPVAEPAAEPTARGALAAFGVRIG